jgi:alpha-D-ribose 1-methylphosphonate 5-triphosphate synthase subunit PhnL
MNDIAEPLVQVRNLSKRFSLHLQGGVVLKVLDGVDLDIHPGDCVVLAGPSGTGKSTLMRSIYANYLPQGGEILVRHGDTRIDMCRAVPRDVIAVRLRTMGYVSQFLRVIPRVPALDVVAEPLRTLHVPEEEARERAAALLTRLRIPERLWQLPPATFSGGEQQRINIARGFIVDYPILLLDEPTASLDAANRQTVIALIQEAKARGAGIIGIFHDEDVRDAVATRLFTIEAENAG